MPRKKQPEKVEAIRNLWESGLAPEQIAEKLGYTKTWVLKVANDNGFGLYKQQTIANRNKEILRLHLDGVRNRDISNIIGISEPRITQILSQNGVTPRRRTLSEEYEIDEPIREIKKPVKKEPEIIIAFGRRFVDCSDEFLYSSDICLIGGNEV